MELSLIHAGLAAGAALAAIPVILHLFMRQTPKHVIFPALRLIRERQKKSRKRMKIKNWLLLAARMALLALMALALARPRLHSDMPLGDESVPTALGLVFDTSLSMSYKENDKTLLDLAKDRAREIISHIPDSSLVFAVNSADPGVPVGLSPSAARKWIDNLTIRPVNRPLNVATGQVYPAVAECDRPRREVYILTDLSRSSWNPDRPAEGLDRVKQATDKTKSATAPKIATFVLRVGSEERKDVSIDEVELSSSTATQGEPLEIRSVVRSQGTEAVSPVVEFYLDGVKKGNQQVEIPAGGQAEARFTTPPRLKEGEVHRVELRLTGAPDPLKFNDERYLSFNVRPCSKCCSSPIKTSTPTTSPRPSIPRRAPSQASNSNGFDRPNSSRGIATRSRTSRPSSCSTSRRSATRPGDCSTATSTKAADWSSAWETAVRPSITTGRPPSKSCRPSSTRRTPRPPPGVK